MNELAPIAVFVYNRPKHTLQLLESLKKNTLLAQSEVYFFSDSAKKPEHEGDVQAVRKVIHGFSGAKKINIVEQTENKGLANSIIAGVSKIFENHHSIIVLEDDLIVSDDILNFFNEGLQFHEKNSSVFSLSGYTPSIEIPQNYKHDTYLVPRISSWGWATWKNRWSTVDWKVSDFSAFIKNKEAIKKHNLGGEDVTAMLINQMTGQIDSWAIRFNYGCYKQNGYCVYPCVTKVKNNGADGTGTHVSATNKYNAEISNKKIQFSNLEPNKEIQKRFQVFYNPSLIRRCINFFKVLRMQQQS